MLCWVLLILLLIYKLPNFQGYENPNSSPPKMCLIMRTVTLLHNTTQKKPKDVCVHNYYKLREINTYPQTILFDIDCFRKNTATANTGSQQLMILSRDFSELPFFPSSLPSSFLIQREEVWMWKTIVRIRVNSILMLWWICMWSGFFISLFWL